MRRTTQMLINADYLKPPDLGLVCRTAMENTDWVFSTVYSFPWSDWCIQCPTCNCEKSEWINRYLLIHYIYNVLQLFCARNVSNILHKLSQLISSPINIAIVSPCWLWGRGLWNHKKNRVCLFLWNFHCGWWRHMWHKHWITELAVNLVKRIIQVLGTLSCSSLSYN